MEERNLERPNDLLLIFGNTNELRNMRREHESEKAEIDWIYFDLSDPLLSSECFYY